MEPVEPEPIVMLTYADGQRRRPIARREILRDRSGFGHSNITVDQQRNRAERILLEIVGLTDTRREGQEVQAIRQPHFLQGPKRAKRACIEAVIELDHLWPASYLNCRKPLAPHPLIMNVNTISIVRQS